MKIIVTSMWYPNYSDLAKITVEDNLAVYCFRQKYEMINFFVDEPVSEDSYEMACRACVKNTELILKLLKDRPDADYVFHRDCDSIILNMNKTIESIIEAYPPEIELFFGGDKYGLSAGQMIVKNTEQVRNYLQEFLENKAKYEHEQDFYGKNPRPFIVVTPQSTMNSYDCETRLESKDDFSNYQQGDFLVHLAGLNLDQKMSVVQKWMARTDFNG